MNAVPDHDNKRTGAISARDPQAGQRRRNILIVGGDSIGIFQQRKARGRGSIEHFSGRKRRDLTRTIPRHTEAIVVVLDRVSHTLARKIRIEAGRRGLPVVYQKRAHVSAVNGNSGDFYNCARSRKGRSRWTIIATPPSNISASSPARPKVPRCCYRTICREAGKVLGSHVHPEVTMHTFPLHLYLDAIQQDDWRTVAALISRSTDKLALAGADFIICPNNTLHQAFDLIDSPIPWLHLVDVVASETARRGFHRVGLLGTRVVMEGFLYPRQLGQLGIDHAIPDEHERARLQDVILNELVAGEIRKESRSYVSVVVERLYQRGCDAVILACTELPLLITSNESVVPLLDSTRLLAKAALRRASAERDSPATKAVLYGHA